MKTFGMIIAETSELERVLAAFGNSHTSSRRDGFEVHTVKKEGATIHVVMSGVGEIYAAAATQMAISRLGAEIILNFGFAGALSPTLSCMQTIILRDLVHYDADLSEIDGIPVGQYSDRDKIEFEFDKGLIETTKAAFPSLSLARVASGDKFIADSKKKKWLVDSFSADVCDMESAGILITALRNGVPAVSIKVISDNADEHGSLSYLEISRKGSKTCADILATLVERLTEE